MLAAGSFCSSMNKNLDVGMGVAVVCTAVFVGCANAQANPRPGGPAPNPPPKGPLPSVVLVHGAFVDGSGWEGVYKLLRRDGYPVSIVQNPTISLADDVAVTARAIGAQSGPVILVGHSYGGVVISAAGNDPKVAALVYIAAYAPDKGESLQTLIANTPPGPPAPPILPPQDGFLALDQSKFPASFAADISADKAAFMAASQVPFGVAALSAPVSTPAWRAKPSFYLVPTADKMIPPSYERTMAKRAGATVTEAEGSHAIFVSRPDVVASVIEQAATATSTQGR
jgi:pimeloyl-ACP methyl ester carboxylesterase